MLPTRPNARTGGGLPSGPRARSVPRSNYYEDDASPSSRTTRQRSKPNPSSSSRNPRPAGSIPNPRERSRARPSEPASRSHGRPDPKSYRTSDNSITSNSSAGSSSFLDRIRGESAGYASSRTSVVEEEYQPKRGRHGRGSSRSGKQRALREENYAETDEGNPESPEPGFGYNIWGRVTTAANSLTVNVGKAWATNVIKYAGEDTPPGQESRLTHAMKAYHLEKARDPSDLPDWLFEAHERQPTRRQPDREGYDDRPDTFSDPPKSRGLRDIYAAAAATSPSAGSTERVPASRKYDDEPAPPKAGDRLRALRDAKRNAYKTNGSSRDEDADETLTRRNRDDGGGMGRNPGGNSGAGERRPPPRVGLPSGPSARKRF